MLNVKRIILLIIIAVLCVAVPIGATAVRKNAEGSGESQLLVLNLWQIDGFEGGKGSRGQYLENKGKVFFKNQSVYLKVTAMSEQSARENLNSGASPDIISYSPTFYGVENLAVGGKFFYKVWCNGGYCLLSVTDNCDFTDANAQNTVINAGKCNLTEVCAAIGGVFGAREEEPISAYLKLLNGKYKYLLGTQRDVFRLRARNAAFTVKPLDCFNDLVQGLTVTAKSTARYEVCKSFCDWLVKNNKDIKTLGLFADGMESSQDELSAFEKIAYKKKLWSPCSENYLKTLKAAAQSGDVNKLKNLIK